MKCAGQNLTWLLIHSLPRLKAKAEEAAQGLVSRGPGILWMLTALCLSPGHTLPQIFGRLARPSNVNTVTDLPEASFHRLTYLVIGKSLPANEPSLLAFI